MKRIIKGKLNIAAGIILASLIMLLIIQSLNRWQAGAADSSVLTITQWTLTIDGTEHDAALPLYLNTPSARTPVTLAARIQAKPGECLYIKTVYAPLRVCIDGTPVYTYGEEGHFPAFLSDPPTNIELIPITETGRPVSVRLEYQSPVSRDVLALHPALLGTPAALLNHLFTEMGFSLGFSVILLALGIILILISILVIQLHKAVFSFFWLGLFSAAVGIWVFGECNLTAIFIRNPALLYLLAFIGLFTFTIPMLKFVLVVLDPKHKRPLQFMCLILEICTISALLLQLTGTVQLSTAMYLFHVLQPLSLCILGICIFADAVYWQNPKARIFLLPILVLALFSILEVCNYYALHITNQMTLFFQIGVLIFMIMMILICSRFVKDALEAQTERHRLEYENHLMERQIEMQKDRYSTLTQIDEDIRQQRHDLRHQLIVLRRFAKNNEPQKLTEYLDTLTVNIPVPLKQYCANEAVNAIAAYYAAMAKKAGIENCDITLDIPAQTGLVPENALCIIIGNMLENALEACRGIKDSSPFIRMKSCIHNGTLTIVMDNSSRPVQYSADGKFLSRKPGGGTGLHSISTVAERYGGAAQFRYNGSQFSSSVYVRLE